MGTSGALGTILPRAIWTGLWVSLAYTGHTSLTFAIASAIIALSVWSRHTARAGLRLALGTSAGVWSAQCFGAILSGHSTAPTPGRC